MGTQSTTTPKMKLTSTIILALAAFASAQLDGQESTEDLIHMLADDANPTEADALVETDADASAVSRLYVGKECANTHKWHIEEDCQSARGHCWVRVADFSSKFGTCRKFCAAQGKGCVDGHRRRKSGARTPATLMASLPGATSHVTTPVVTQVMLSADAPLISLTNPWF